MILAADRESEHPSARSDLHVTSKRCVSSDRAERPGRLASAGRQTALRGHATANYCKLHGMSFASLDLRAASVVFRLFPTRVKIKTGISLRLLDPRPSDFQFLLCPIARYAEDRVRYRTRWAGKCIRCSKCASTSGEENGEFYLLAELSETCALDDYFKQNYSTELFLSRASLPPSSRNLFRR